MFFEIVNRVRILIKFDQNPANHHEKITQANPTENVQNRFDQFY
jgi:hypothetical protein